MSEGKSSWQESRKILQNLVNDESPQNLPNLATQKGFSVDECVQNQSDVTMHMPCHVGDYTDFYASKEHATNVGCMFRDPNNALLPNWLHIPVGYHGRASSVCVSGTPIVRPHGQTVAKDAPDGPPGFGPSKLLDFELEVGCFVGGSATEIGQHLSKTEAADRLFGLVLLNDLTARDIQKWEYIPLGPFLGKNFATAISPWIVPMDAFEPFRCATPEQINPTPLPYLKQKDGEKQAVDIQLFVDLKTNNGGHKTVCESNLKYMYWSLQQQLIHHTSNGCNVNPGDLFGTGTISGPTKDGYGSLLEITWAGKEEIVFDNGDVRKFMQDGDVCTMRGYAEKDGVRVGFGEVTNEIIPAKTMNLS